MLSSRLYLPLTLLALKLFISTYPLVGQEDTVNFKSGEHVDPSQENGGTDDTKEKENQHSSQQNVGIFESSEHVDPSHENAPTTKTTDTVDKTKEKKEKKEEPAIKVSGGVTFISDYRSRGLSQSMRRPAVQGEITFTHKSGVYFKNWGSNVDGARSFLNDASLEWDIYLGYEHKILKSEFKFDVGFEYYYYPGARAAVPRQISYDTLEYYIALSYKGFNIRLYQTLTDFFAVNSHNPPVNTQTSRPVRPNGHSYHSPYIEMNYVWAPTPKLTTSLHIGFQGVTNYYNQLSYFDWQAALAYKFDWFDLNLFYIDTTARRAFYNLPDSDYKGRKKYIGGATLVFGVSKGF